MATSVKKMLEAADASVPRVTPAQVRERATAAERR